MVPLVWMFPSPVTSSQARWASFSLTELLRASCLAGERRVRPEIRRGDDWTYFNSKSSASCPLLSWTSVVSCFSMLITWFLSGLARDQSQYKGLRPSSLNLPTGSAGVEFVGVLESEDSLLQSHDLKPLGYRHYRPELFTPNIHQHTFSPASWNLASSNLKYSSWRPGELGDDFLPGLKSISAGRSLSTRKASSVSASSNSVTETRTACSLLRRFWFLNEN